MLCTCKCSDEGTRSQLRKMLAVADPATLAEVEVEFKEVPYFMVARSRVSWNPDSQGDINVVELVAVTDSGLIVSPDGPAASQDRRTLVPWQNVISLSTTRTNKGSE